MERIGKKSRIRVRNTHDVRGRNFWATGCGMSANNKGWLILKEIALEIKQAR